MFNFRIISRNWLVCCALFFTSITSTLPFPFISLFALEELGKELSKSGYYYVVSALFGMALVPFIGRLSDRFGRRLIVAGAAAIWLALGSVCLSLTTSMTVLILTGAVFMSVMAVPAAQLLSIAREQLRQQNTGAAGDIGTIRLAYVVGWIAGPALGGLILSLGASYRDLFRLQATLFIVLAAGVLIASRAYRLLPASIVDQPEKTSSATRSGEVLILLAAVAFGLCGDMVRSTTLPLLIHTAHGGGPAEISAAFSIVPLAEIPLSILAILAAKRVGERIVLLAGALACCLYFLLLPLAPNVAVILALQVVYAVVPACTIGIAIGAAQRLLPNNVGFATSAVVSSQNAAVLIGAAIVALGSALFDLQGVFWIAAAFAAVAVGLHLLGFSVEASAGKVERT